MTNYGVTESQWDCLVHPDVSHARFQLAVSRELNGSEGNVLESVYAHPRLNERRTTLNWADCVSGRIYNVSFLPVLGCIFKKLEGGAGRVHQDSWSLVSGCRCAESVMRTKCNQMKLLWLCLNAAIKSLRGNTQEVKVALHFSAQQGWLSSPN